VGRERPVEVQHHETPDAAGLLRNLYADPEAALRGARELLGSTRDPAALSILRQVIGIVLRDRGEMEPALAELRHALRLARAANDPDRIPDIEATLGATLAMSGRTAQGLTQLDRAVAASRGAGLGQVLARRAYVLRIVGRYTDALADLRQAHRLFARSGDRVWEARVVNIRGWTEIALGRTGAAERDFVRAADLYRELGHEFEIVNLIHNRGIAAYVGGDLPRAFVLFSQAAEGLERMGEVNNDLVVDRCAAYLTGGLAQEALEVVEAALARPNIQPRHRAELLLVRANAALQAGDSATAAASATAARAAFRRQQREWFEVRAQLTAISALRMAGSSTATLTAQAALLVDRMRPLRVPEFPQALLLAGRLAEERDASSSQAYYGEAGTYRRAAVGTTRAVGWLATALDRRTRGERRGVLRACASGLDALEQHQATLGSPEMRALATRHGIELAELGTRTTLAGGDARPLLRWAERWRATALAQPRVTPGGDEAAAAELAAWRHHARSLTEALAAGKTTDALERRLAHLEQVIRHRRLQAAGTGARSQRFDVDGLLAALAGDQSRLVELMELDGELHAILAGGERVERFRVGPVSDAVQALELAHFTLRRAARGLPVRLEPIGGRLQQALLGGVARALGPGGVVVSPTSRFHAVPWGLLPVLADAAVTTAPSAALWMRARSTPESADGATVLVVGPGLAGAGAEVLALESRIPGATLLAGGSATVDRTLHVVDGARLVHLAAHGRFRPDSPMFSALLLDDGPLVVHDFERLARAPYRVVLSACESGVMKPVGADELLGLGATLLSLGSAGIVSSVAIVNDEATVAVMDVIHGELLRGSGLGVALLAARAASEHDPTMAATAASFTALGV
jgi:tetratricopeptide (TPR) repeat protein